MQKNHCLSLKSRTKPADVTSSSWFKPPMTVNIRLLLLRSWLSLFVLLGNWQEAKLRLERDVVALEPFGEGLLQATGAAVTRARTPLVPLA